MDTNKSSNIHQTKLDSKDKQVQKNSEQIIDFSEEAEAKERRHAKKKKKFSVLKIILICLISIIVLLMAFCIWNRWFRYSDTTDIVSNWQVSGTGTTIKIDKKQIYLDKNTIFSYEVDEGAKLIYLKTGDYSGTCHYRFSGDRCQLALIDSGDMNAVATLWSDIGWFFDYLKCKIGGVDISPAYTKESGQEGGSTDEGIDEIIVNGKGHSTLLDKVSTQKAPNTQ